MSAIYYIEVLNMLYNCVLTMLNILVDNIYCNRLEKNIFFF